MTDYSRSNILLPHFEEAEALLNALDGKDAQFTFQTLMMLKCGVMKKKTLNAK